MTYEIKEHIRKSAGLELADEEAGSLIAIRLVTLDPDSGNPGNRTIYSIVWTAQTYHDVPVTMFLSSSVGLCGSSRVSECAAEIVAEADSYSDTVNGWIREAAKNTTK